MTGTTGEAQDAQSNTTKKLQDQAPESFVHDMAVNFNGPYFLMRLLTPTFRAQRSGCVLNIASRAGTVFIPYSTSYCASKAALINLTGCVQKEFDVEGFSDVHLYSLHPGGVKSTMTDASMSLLFFFFFFLSFFFSPPVFP
jgi:NAD(P)-dependent dehydrogenase (short-subunit alcohol dehydrogenase family)